MSATQASRTDTSNARAQTRPLTARAARIAWLLEQHSELSDPLRSGQGFGAGGLTLMPHAGSCLVGKSSPPRCTCWRRDVVELERLLALMRKRAKQESVRWWDDDAKRWRSASLGTLRFHVLAWYVNASRVGQWRPIEVKKGRKLKLPTGQDVLRTRSGRIVPARHHVTVTRHRDAREDRARLGVEWMALRWSLGHEPEARPMLPGEEAA